MATSEEMWRGAVLALLRVNPDSWVRGSAPPPGTPCIVELHFAYREGWDNPSPILSRITLDRDRIEQLANEVPREHIAALRQALDYIEHGPPPSPSIWDRLREEAEK